MPPPIAAHTASVPTKMLRMAPPRWDYCHTPLSGTPTLARSATAREVFSCVDAAPQSADLLPHRLDTIGDHRIAITQVSITQSIRDFENACRAGNIKHRVVAESGDAFTRLVELARYHDLMVFGLRSVFECDFVAGDPESVLIRLILAQ